MILLYVFQSSLSINGMGVMQCSPSTICTVSKTLPPMWLTPPREGSYRYSSMQAVYIHTHKLSLSLSLSHTHTHTHMHTILSLSHTQSYCMRLDQVEAVDQAEHRGVHQSEAEGELGQGEEHSGAQTLDPEEVRRKRLLRFQQWVNCSSTCTYSYKSALHNLRSTLSMIASTSFHFLYFFYVIHPGPLSNK